MPETAAASYERAPALESYDVAPLAKALGVSSDQICVPSQCVYAVPGEPAQCTDDCSKDHYTRYVADRSKCSPQDLLRVPPWIDTAFALPESCLDSERPGLRQTDGKWRPCACFDGTPLHPVGSYNLKDVVFDCSWPEGRIPLRDVRLHAYIPTDAQCLPRNNDWTVEPGFAELPYTEYYALQAGTILTGIQYEEICVPTRCTFSIPGAPAQCSDDCSPTLETTYFVERDRCH